MRLMNLHCLGALTLGRRPLGAIVLEEHNGGNLRRSPASSVRRKALPELGQASFLPPALANKLAAK